MPEPPGNLPGHPSEVTYQLTPRGLAWAADVEPLPEDIDGYMEILRRLVPGLDSVIEQYVREGLSSFGRQTYFSAAVMVGAAAEKAVYLLAESIVDAFTDARRQETFKRLIERRKLNELFRTMEKTIHDAYVSKALPFPVFDGAVTHLMSLIEAIKVQRNDAVHPMNATYRRIQYDCRSPHFLTLWKS